MLNSHIPEGGEVTPGSDRVESEDNLQGERRQKRPFGALQVKGDHKGVQQD